MVVTFDVVWLFTKTSVERACEVIKERLMQDKTLKKRTHLEVSDIMTLLRFVLSTTCFRVGGKYNQLMFEVAKRRSVSPIVFNLYMENLEQMIIQTSPYRIT